MKTDETNEQGKRTGEPNTPDSRLTKSNVTKSGAALIIAVILIFGMGLIIYVSQRQSRDQINSLYADRNMMSLMVHTRDSSINDFMAAFDEIDSSISAINNMHHILVNEAVNNELNPDKRKKILKEIQFVNYQMDQNKKEIAELTAKLNRSGAKLSLHEKKLASLNKRIEELDSNISLLKKQLAEKDFEISQLNLKVNDLNGQIKMQTSQLSSLESQLASLDVVLNRAYLVSGTYKQLKAKGIITRDGGLLGIGGNVHMASAVPDNTFEPLDIRQTKSITLSARKAEFISNHPKDSYQWVKSQNKIESLVITDPDKFWKYTKYAVLETR
jgi:hypothetical protein